MKRGTKVLLIIGVIALILIFTGISNYNRLVVMSENVESAWSQIDIQLQRRSDLIPNLVATVKKYAEHEEEVFTSVSDARARLAGAGSVSELAEADAELTGALSRLLAIAESYRNLKPMKTL